MVTEKDITLGAQVNTKDKNWMTPLHYSAMASSSVYFLNKSKESIQLLLSLNADLLIRSKLWHTPLHIAAGINNLECLEMIAAKMKLIMVTDRMGWNALHHAAYKGCTDNVKYLIKKGIHPKHTDKKNRTPLHYAALSGAIDLVSILIESGAQVNACDKLGLTPLHFAAMKSSSHACKELVKFGADVTENKAKFSFSAVLTFMLISLVFLSTDNSGRSILHYLAYNGNLAGLCCLSDHKFNIDEPDEDGWTALHMACYKDELEMAIRLVRMNADVSCRTNDGRTPLHFAALSKNEILVKYLLDQGAKKELADTLMRTPLHYSIFSINLEIASQLLELKDYSIKDLYGRSEFVELIISNGISVDSTDNESRTPLHYASFFDEEGHIVNTLIGCSSTSLKDIHGFLPLHYAFYGNKTLNIATVNYLKLFIKLLEKTSEIITDISPCISLLHILLQVGVTEYLPTILKRYDCTHIPFDDDGLFQRSPLFIWQPQEEKCTIFIIVTEKFLIFCSNISRILIFVLRKSYMASISNIDCLKALLEHSSTPQDLNIKTKDNLTALSISVLNKSSEALIRYLVKKGSHLNVSFSSHLISLIHVANRKSGALLCSQVGSLLCLKVLQKYEADLNLLDAEMYSPLQWACIKEYLSRGSFSWCHFQFFALRSVINLIKLSFNQSIHSVNAILEVKREIPQLFDSYLRTPLHYAVALDEPLIVESLLNSGASLSIKNSLGETPIHIAAVNNNRLILNACLAHPCDLSIVDDDGNTALHLACLGGHKENATLLATKMTQEELSIQNNQGEM
ncbi:hypothetical protein MXB_222 [Myxobolus squamalis]|nr:hypothetical protein MXB_222 [Myxobolus squamalis]